MKSLKIFTTLALILSLVLPIAMPGVVSAERKAGRYLSGLLYHFDGVDEHGKSGGNPSGYTDTSGSMCVWFRPDINMTSNGTDILIGMGGSSTAAAENASALFFIGRRYNSGSGVDNEGIVFHRPQGTTSFNEQKGTTRLVAGTNWFLCVTSNGSTWKMYVNGAQETLSLGTGAGSNTGDWFGDLGSLGTAYYSVGSAFRRNGWGTSHYDGRQDDTFVTSTEITLAQHIALYNNGKPVHPCVILTCSNVRVYYKFGELENGVVSTLYAAIGTPSTDNITVENMEDSDTERTSYY